MVKENPTFNFATLAREEIANGGKRPMRKVYHGLACNLVQKPEWIGSSIL